jgi:outer membrane protein TolC
MNAPRPSAAKRWCAAAAAALLAAGCAVPPKVPSPPAAVSEALASLPALPGGADAKAAADAVAPFWRGFGDVELERLIGAALVENADARIAAARVREAKAAADGTGALGKPTLDLGADAGRSRDAGETANAFSAGFTAGWEIDLFGAIAAQQQAAGAQLRSSEAGREAVLVTVAAETALAYVAERRAATLIALAQQSLAAQRATLVLLCARLDAGRGTRLDVERAAALVAGTRATLVSLGAVAEAGARRLDLLRNRASTAPDSRLAPQRLRNDAMLAAAAPRASIATASATGVTATLPPACAGTSAEAAGAASRARDALAAAPDDALARLQDPAGTPEQRLAELLPRRPDVRAAEAQFAAAALLTEAERARLWPTLKLGSGLGQRAVSLSAFGSSGALTWSLGSALAWSLVDHGAKQAAVDAALARGEVAAIAFERTVNDAIGEVELARSLRGRNRLVVAELSTAATAADAAAVQARARFEAGASDFLVLLDAERERIAAQERLVQARAAVIEATIALYRALAGGW